MIRNTIVGSKSLKEKRETACSSTAKNRTDDEDSVTISKVVGKISELFGVGKLIQHNTTYVRIASETDNHIRLQILVRIEHFEHSL